MNTEAFAYKPKLTLKSITQLERYAPSSLSEKLKQYYCRHRSRQQLLTLDDERLADIGLSREQVLAEAQLPFWR